MKNTLKKVCSYQNMLYICISKQANNNLKNNKMTNSTITKGTKIESNKLVMVVTGETEKAFLGYHEYKGKVVGQCSIAKDMFTNPHYMNNIKITNEA